MKNTKSSWIIKAILSLILFAAAFMVNRNFGSKFKSFDTQKSISQIIEIILIFLGLLVIVPQQQSGLKNAKKKFNKMSILIILGAVILIPLTIILGLKFLGETNYYILSSLVIIESFILFFLSFENKKASSRELVIISVMCALSVVGRIAFAPVPQFKPMSAIIIISGVAFGGSSGFLIGTVAAFVSNFYFGQGSWTLWQMLGSGIVGFLSGFLTNAGILKKNSLSLSIFGFLAVVFIYGGIVNISSTLMYMPKITLGSVLSSWALGIPFDLVHGASTVLFIRFIGMPILEKLERVKTKYGIDKNINV